jgi:hypothetical protein
MSYALSVYKEIVSRYSDIVYDTWEVASAPQAQTLPLAAALKSESESGSNLNLPHSGNHSCLVPKLSIDSLSALTVSALLR